MSNTGEGAGERGIGVEVEGERGIGVEGEGERGIEGEVEGERGIEVEVEGERGIEGKGRGGNFSKNLRARGRERDSPLLTTYFNFKSWIRKGILSISSNRNSNSVGTSTILVTVCFIRPDTPFVLF